jgi:hypothetical protein
MRLLALYSYSEAVGLAQPSAVQASLYRHHFSATGFTSATPKSALYAIFSAIQASQ